MDRWTGRVVVVTGASSGIGKSIVVELSKYPMKIVALARRIDVLQELVEDLRSSVAEIYPVQCDLTDETDVLKAFERIETTVGQGVSIMINNAGTLTKTQMLSGVAKDWRNMFDLNVVAATVCCRESYKSMKKFGITDGHVININSTAGHTMLPLPEQKMYNATKTALAYLTEGFRHELVRAGSKIKVTSINPGRVISEVVGGVKTGGLSMNPERVASMITVALSTPPDIVIAELTVLTVGETIHAYALPMI